MIRNHFCTLAETAIENEQKYPAQVVMDWPYTSSAMHVVSNSLPNLANRIQTQAYLFEHNSQSLGIVRWEWSK